MSESPDKKTWPIPNLEENVHFYMENGFMVFTQAYHLARGRCCGCLLYTSDAADE